MVIFMLKLYLKISLLMSNLEQDKATFFSSVIYPKTLLYFMALLLILFVYVFFHM